MLTRALTARNPPRYIAIPGPPLPTALPSDASSKSRNLEATNYARFSTKLVPLLLFLLTLMTLKQYLLTHRPTPPVCNCNCINPSEASVLNRFSGPIGKSLNYKVFPRKPWITSTESPAEAGMRVGWKGKVMSENWEEITVKGWFMVRRRNMEEDEEGRVRLSLEKGRVEVTKEEIMRMMVTGECEGVGVALGKEGEGPGGEEGRWEFFYGCKG